MKLTKSFWIKIEPLTHLLGNKHLAVGAAVCWLKYASQKTTPVTESEWLSQGFPTELVPLFALRTAEGYEIARSPDEVRLSNIRSEAGKFAHFGTKRSKTSKTKQNVANAKTQEAKPNLIIKAWCDAYSRKYGTKYDITRKDAGMLAGFAKDRSLDKASTLFACYLAMELEFYTREKHPLSLFFRDLPKITYAAQTGVDPTRKKTLVEEYLEAEAKKARKALT